MNHMNKGKKKKPDLVVWNETDGYSARQTEYPTNLGAVTFQVPNISLVRTNAAKKMVDVFERERQEIVDRIKKLSDEYAQSVMVWESKISFEPIIGRTYFLYHFKNGLTLSMLSPNEWNKHEYFVGAYTLTSENKWITA